MVRGNETADREAHRNADVGAGRVPRHREVDREFSTRILSHPEIPMTPPRVDWPSTDSP